MAKTILFPVSVSPEKNPWRSITLQNTIASCDKKHKILLKENRYVFGSSAYISAVKKAYPKVQLAFNCLPGPYSGDPNSNVYCLNMNPGEPDMVFENLIPSPYTNGAMANLKHQPCTYSNSLEYVWPRGLIHDGSQIKYDLTQYESLIKTAPLKTTFPRPSDAAIWQECIIKSLKKELGRYPKIFCIEYFPYHSAHQFSFPDDLPSYKYRDFLIDNAMAQGKLIIIMRGEKLWYSIKNRNLGDKLIVYPWKLRLSSQRTWLSYGNFMFNSVKVNSLGWNMFRNFF